MTAPLCKDCVHFKTATFDDDDFSKCGRPASVSRVTGRAIPHRWDYCKTQRDLSWLDARLFGACGKSGRFFERRTKP